MSNARLFGAITLIALSLFLLLGFVEADLADRGFLVAALTFVIAVALPAVGGMLLFFGIRRTSSGRREKREARRRQTLEAEVLRLATARAAGESGACKLTAVELASALTVDLETATATLQDLHRRSVAELELTDDGTIVYAFRDLAGPRQKNAARAVLDA